MWWCVIGGVLSVLDGVFLKFVFEGLHLHTIVMICFYFYLY